MKIMQSGWLLLVAAAACTDSTGRVSFSTTTRSGAPAASVTAAISAALQAGPACSGLLIPAPTGTTDQLCITSAGLILREVELKRVEVAACDALPDNGDCADFETGPAFLPLPLTSTQVSADVSVKDAPPGMYDRLEFEVHKPDATEVVQGLPQGFPSGISIEVQGTFNGTAFDYQTDLNAKQEVRFATPLDLAAGTTKNVTLSVDLSGWFKNASGTALVDPASANKGQPNESVVANNIQVSFKGFEDDNHDGISDH